MHDRKRLPGLVHLIEHVIILDKGLRDYLSRHGGRAVGETRLNYTLFQFDVAASHLEVRAIKQSCLIRTQRNRHTC